MVELHNVGPHHDHVFRVHSLHLAESVQYLTISIDAIVLEAWYQILDEKSCQHVMDLDVVNHVFLGFVIVLDSCLLF